MGVVKKIIGPKSKYDKRLPYTYEAKIDMLHGYSDKPVYDYYFADTICGLVEYLHENAIQPEDVTLYEVYRDGEFEVKKEFCLTPTGGWLKRPDICKSMKKHYRGHSNEKTCAFRDRDRQGSGPY